VHLVLFLQLMGKSAAQKTQMMRLYLIRVQQAMLYLVPMRQLSKDLHTMIQVMSLPVMIVVGMISP